MTRYISRGARRLRTAGEDDTAHLLASPANAERLRRSYRIERQTAVAKHIVSKYAHIWRAMAKTDTAPVRPELLVIAFVAAALGAVALVSGVMAAVMM